MEAATIARARIRVSCAPDQVWPALVDPERLAGWLGLVDKNWPLPGPGHIDFGAGDFFEVARRRTDTGHLVEFEWSYLGLAPPSRVHWSVTAITGGAEITAEDSDPARGAADTAQRTSEWADLLDRLACLLAGGPPGPACPDTIEGSVLLSGDLSRLFAADRIAEWLPMATDGLSPRWFFIVDADGPRRFPLENWAADPRSLSFTVRLPDLGRRTACRVLGEQAVSGARLSYEHTGWSALGLPDRQARLLRRRFAATWAASLSIARDLAVPA
jgi:uncharacterized protein YndB with AHSA1/START domain